MFIERLLNAIEAKDQQHAIKLRDYLSGFGAEYFLLADAFYENYERYLLSIGCTLDYGVDCYLRMLENMADERLQFIRNETYSNSSFAEVDAKIYANPEIMLYHMHGLVLAQFLWFDQYERVKFFIDNLQKYFKNGQAYLEIGGGHGLYVFEAMKLLPTTVSFDLVDISESSLELAKGILNTDKVSFFLKDIFDFTNDIRYDFITIGEVLEHVEDPLALLKKIGIHLNANGVCYLTTPVNAPMIDHIYLFSDEQQIRDLIAEAGFEIIEERIVISEKKTPEKAKRQKIPIMYAGFIKKM
jgi:2-polyprenyl-3-methyl-5-hydroxy-6-metoxy-1,4-benzoquinol methylase